VRAANVEVAGDELPAAALATKLTVMRSRG
jgi:hypothetical protein